MSLMPLGTGNEPAPPVQIIPTLVDAAASLGLAYVQAIVANPVGALLARTYRWSWASGGAGITLSGADTAVVTLTSLSLTPATRSGTLQLEVTSPALKRTFQVPVTIRHQ